jgi:hypothetical protein
MGNRQLVWLLAIVVLAVAAYFILRPPGDGVSDSSQPSPHAIDQSQ